MRELAIRCPETGLPVRTGTFSTRTSFPAMKVRGTLKECAACGKSHDWKSEEAWLIEPDQKTTPFLI